MPEATFGTELRRLRFGESLASVAGRSGLSVMALHLFEENRQAPTRAALNALLAALDPGPGAVQYLRELVFLARRECCPRCHFGGEEPLGTAADACETR